MNKFGPKAVQRVRETVALLVEEHRLPGLSIGVALGQELAYAEARIADIEDAAPGPHLRQRIGSITKTMWAVCYGACR
jgi:CubicO group peptidase (beta-lactamase class C family)